LIGLLLGFGVVVLADIGFDRDRVFYPTLLIVIATYYALFAIIGCSRRTFLIESLVVSAFSLVSREILS
jgi:hypothetical protein